MQRLSTVLGLFTLIFSTSHFAVGANHVEDLAWLSGQWVNTDGQVSEMTFTEPQGGMILGTSQIVNGGMTTFFEFTRIIEQKGTLIEMPMPNGVAGVNFTLKEISPSRVVFENPKHAFPSQIIYEATSADGLKVTIEGTQAGKAAAWSLSYHRVKSTL